MREFPNATPRPWRIKTDGPAGNNIEGRVATWPDGSDRFAVVASFQGAATSKTTYLEEQAACEDNGNLIVHAVNTYEERERLLDEAAEALRNLCIAIDAEADLGRPFPERYPRTIKGVRAILAKLEARDA